MPDIYGRSAVIRILMDRDGMTQEEAERFLGECQQRVASGEDPEAVLIEDLGLEPDYIWAVIQP